MAQQASSHRAPSPRKKIGKPASDNPVLLDFGARLAQRRRDLRMVQNEVAEMAGVSRSTLHTIEHGGPGVRWEKVLAVAEVLHMKLSLHQVEQPQMEEAQD